MVIGSVVYVVWCVGVCVCVQLIEISADKAEPINGHHNWLRFCELQYAIEGFP